MDKLQEANYRPARPTSGEIWRNIASTKPEIWVAGDARLSSRQVAVQVPADSSVIFWGDVQITIVSRPDITRYGI